jgi:hypothetical protein
MGHEVALAGPWGQRPNGSVGVSYQFSRIKWPTAVFDAGTW